MRRIRATLPLAMLAGMLLGPAPSAKATLEISIASGAFHTTIIDQTAGDQNTGAGLIQVAVNPINAALKAAGIHLKFADLGAMSSLPNNLPGAVLSVNGDLSTTGGKGGTIIIDLTDLGYRSLRPETMISTDSESFVKATGKRTFESWEYPHSFAFAKVIPAPLITHKLAATSSLSDTTMTSLLPPLFPFGLTNETVITLTKGTIGFSGKTTVTGPAVPEPATIMSGLVGAPLLALGLYRRHRRSRA
jgi:hypothetical protein